MEVRKRDQNGLGRCPFHADETASLVVTPHMNPWYCLGSQIGGGPINWVMKARGVRFRHGVELLRSELEAHSFSAADAPVAALPVSSARRCAACRRRDWQQVVADCDHLGEHGKSQT